MTSCAQAFTAVLDGVPVTWEVWDKIKTFRLVLFATFAMGPSVRSGPFHRCSPLIGHPHP